MKRCFITFGFLVMAVMCVAQELSGPEQALRFHLAGWSHEVLYQSTLVSPQAFCLDEHGDILVYSRGARALFRVERDGNVTLYQECGDIIIRAIGWQDACDRFLVTDSAHGDLLELKDGEFSLMRRLDAGEFFSTMAFDPSDGSLFTGNESRGSTIRHYDKDFNLLEVLADNVQGCYQFAFDGKVKRLYFSETYAGTVSAINLTSGKREVLVENLGFEGTFEPIPVLLDGDGVLHICDLNRGILAYKNGRIRHVMDTMTGGGEYLYSPVFDDFVTLHTAGANLVLYDRARRTTADLTPYLNSHSIAIGENGECFYTLEPPFGLVNIKDGFVTEFPGIFNEPVYHLEFDGSGSLYAADAAGRILSVTSSGRSSVWMDLHPYARGSISTLSFDKMNNAFVTIVASYERDEAVVLRVGINTRKVELVAKMTDVARGPALPRGCVDDKGNVYIIERRRNVLYRVANGSSSLSVVRGNVLADEAVTTPSIEYSRSAERVIIGDYERYFIVDPKTGTMEELAVNLHGADNFALNESATGAIAGIHSGQVYLMRYK